MMTLRRACGRLIVRIDQTLHTRNFLLILAWIAVLYFYHLWLVGQHSTSPPSQKSESKDSGVMVAWKQDVAAESDEAESVQESDFWQPDSRSEEDVMATTQTIIQRPSTTTVMLATTESDLFVKATDASTTPQDEDPVKLESGQRLETASDTDKDTTVVDYDKLLAMKSASAPNVDRKALEYEQNWFNGTLRPHGVPVVPNIAHFVWYTCHEFHYYHLISLLSVYTVMRADRILFHTDCEPDGRWWTEAKLIPVLEVIFREAPTSVFGQKLNPYWPSHSADITRLQVLLEYGGIYFDPDVFVVNSLEPLRHYDFVMGRPREGRLNNAVIISRKDSRFLRLYYESYKLYNSSCYLCNSIENPSRIAYFYRSLIHIELFTLVCSVRDLWRVQIYGNFDWKHTRYTLHFFSKFIIEPLNPESIKTMNNTAGEVARYIYYGVREAIPESVSPPRWWQTSVQLSHRQTEIKSALRQADKQYEKTLPQSQKTATSSTISTPIQSKTEPRQARKRDSEDRLKGTLQRGEDVNVPNIVHYIWFNCKEFHFYHFLSLLSAFRIVQPRTIYFHTDCPPSGRWWEEAKMIPRFEVLDTRQPKVVFMHSLNPENAEHVVDVAKILTLMAYGGIVSDPDVFFINSLKPLRYYEFTLGLPSASRQVSNSLIISTKDASFLRLYYSNYMKYDGECDICNSILFPTKLASERSDLTHLTHLSSDGLPKVKRPFQTKTYQTVNWREKRYAIQFAGENLRDLNPLSIRELESTIGEVSRYIFYGKSKPIRSGENPPSWLKLPPLSAQESPGEEKPPSHKKKKAAKKQKTKSKKATR